MRLHQGGGAAKCLRIASNEDGWRRAPTATNQKVGSQRGIRTHARASSPRGADVPQSTPYSVGGRSNQRRRLLHSRVSSSEPGTRETATVRVLSVKSCRLMPKATRSAPATSWNSRKLPARLGRCHGLRLVTNQSLELGAGGCATSGAKPSLAVGGRSRRGQYGGEATQWYWCSLRRVLRKSGTDGSSCTA